MSSTTTRSGTVQEIMSRRPVAVGAATSASELALVLDQNEISGVPVIDAQDRVIGVVSRTDLLHACVAGPVGSSPGSYLSAIAEGLGADFDAASLGIVNDFMNPEPVTAGPDETIAAVARRMLEERVHRVVVVDGDRRLLGIVTSLDMLRVIAS